VLDFSQPDTLAASNDGRGLVLRGRPLAYQVCVPEWREKGTFSRGEMMALLKEHVQTIASRYRGRVRVRDVVIEALTHDGSPDSTSHLLWGAIPSTTTSSAGRSRSWRGARRRTTSWRAWGLQSRP
jgi:GH35 family endo-1,4-beta-xylanase